MGTVSRAHARGGDYGIAPVLAASVTFTGVEVQIDRTFDSAGAMHAANEFIWLHYDEINGFPQVDLTGAVPEFPSTIVLPTFMIAMLLATVIYKRKQTIYPLLFSNFES
ncbi:MAG: hypothetical protein OEW71_01670 [Candidatus Bathyarchaeota archaeon]|nr:hypothetical protein [Candidatus Bathyarchaeota archaeon]